MEGSGGNGRSVADASQVSVVSNAPPDCPQTAHRSELTRNQVWEAGATFAKAAFFFAVCPAITAQLGREAFGLFAVALSALACVVASDFGIRLHTRIRLSEAMGDAPQQAKALAASLAAYALLLAGMVVCVSIVASAGGWASLLRLPAGGDRVIAVTAAAGAVYVFSLLLLEPLAASGRLSTVRAAVFWGNVIALPAVLGAASLHASVAVLIAAYLAALTAPNLLTSASQKASRERLRDAAHAMPSITWQDVAATFGGSRWYALTAFTWLAKSYGLTFIIGSAWGTAEAGRYFILLKLSELLSVLGASIADTTIAGLATLRTPGERAARFALTLRYVLAMSLPGFVLLACACSVLLQKWFHQEVPDAAIGIWVGLHGLAAGFRSVVLAACIGAGLRRMAALSSVAETALAVGGTFAVLHASGLAAVFMVGFASAASLLPAAFSLARSFQASSVEVWLKPAAVFLVGAAGAAALAFGGFRSGSWLWVAAAAAWGAIASMVCLRAAFRPST